MAKIQLGKRPASFKHTLNLALLDGTKGRIEISYKYRTKKEFGEFLDGLFAEAGQEADTSDQKKSIAELLGKTIDKNADYLLRVLEGWDLDVELNRENVEQMCDEFPGVAASIMESYRLAIVEGRLGN